MPTKTSVSFREPHTYEEATELLWSLQDAFSVQSIGTSATGKSLYALSIGEPGSPTVVYCGTDPVTATGLLRFAFSLPTLLSKNTMLHRIHLLTLLAHRHLCFCPFLCPDGLGTEEPLTNGFGANLPDCFGDAPISVPEKVPEVTAIKQYLTYTEPAMLCVFQKGATTELYPTTPRTPTDHLLSRLLSAVPSPQDTPAFVSIPRWYTAETGHLSYGITVSPHTDLSAFLVTAPLLIGTTGG